MPNIRKFFKRRNSISILALIVMLGLTLPRIVEDVAQVKFWYTGDYWNIMTAAAGVNPNFLVYEIAIFALDVIMIFFLVLFAFRSDKRIEE